MEVGEREPRSVGVSRGGPHGLQPAQLVGVLSKSLVTKWLVEWSRVLQEARVYKCG